MLKRKEREAHVKLTKLTALNCERFIRGLVEHASIYLTSIVGALNGELPDYMLDLEKYRAETTIAYAVNKFNSNPDPLTVKRAREIKIKDLKDTREIDDDAASELLFPHKERKERARLKANFQSQAESIIVYAELKMSEETKSALNSDLNYVAAKNGKCLISWLTRLRIRGSTASSNVKDQILGLKDQLEKLIMGSELKDYFPYKIEFIKLTEALKLLIQPQLWEEATKITLFISHLDPTIFSDLLLNRLRNNDNEVAKLATLADTYRFADSYFESVKLSRSILAKPESIERAYIATTPNKRQKTSQDNRTRSPKPSNSSSSSNSSSNNNNYFSICKYFVPGDATSCNRGDKCRYTHLDTQASLDEARALIDKLKGITNKH